MGIVLQKQASKICISPKFPKTKSIPCARCQKPIVGEYEIMKREKAFGRWKTVLLCKSCNVKRLERRAKIDDIRDVPNTSFFPNANW